MIVFYILSVMFLVLTIINIGLWAYLSQPTNPYRKYNKVLQIVINLLMAACILSLIVYIATVCGL